MFNPQKHYVGSSKWWKLFNGLDFTIEAEELYVAHWKNVADSDLKEVIRTFQSICPNHTDECYIVLARRSDLGSVGYLIFPHFEDAHRMHGIVALLGELDYWTEIGSKAYIAYLNDNAQKLVIRLHPNAHFVSAVLNGRYRRFR